ncbi:DUF4232 domain-containing protein [Nocardiopsis mangrovi]|uniref:DUF4232 domain-containing protein n=1 Tax=Nocardiopsis mangrovi TaxID=1179818 RepID=A0ABV9E0M4_9ACTN
MKKIGVRPARTFALGAVVASALAVSAPAAFAEDGSEAGTTSVRDCVSTDFITEMSREGAAGNVYIEVTFEKLPPASPYDDEACTMYGALDRMYWGDDEGERIGGFAQQEGDADSVFSLSPGEEAVMTITRPNTENYDEWECEPTEVGSAYLQFMNEGEPFSYSTDGQDSVCATQLSVSTISEITKVGA